MVSSGYAESEDDKDIIDLPEGIRPGRYLLNGGVAARLCVSRQTVRWLTNVGRLGCLETPLGRLYTEEHIERYLRKRAQLWPSHSRKQAQHPKPSA